MPAPYQESATAVAQNLAILAALGQQGNSGGGATGPTGATGPAGSAGANGATGATGAAGAGGATGATGAAGVTQTATATNAGLISIASGSPTTIASSSVTATATGKVRLTGNGQVDFNGGGATGSKNGITFTLTCGAQTYVLIHEVVQEASTTQRAIITLDHLFTAVPAGAQAVSWSAQANEGTTTGNVSIGKSDLCAVVFNA
jgi:hypothetical protein